MTALVSVGILFVVMAQQKIRAEIARKWALRV
jgi:hypothetical protein